VGTYVADPRPARRIRDPEAVRAFIVSARCCECCGQVGRLSAHHVLPRARGGDDVSANLIALLGDGVGGCHGKFHEGEVIARQRIGYAILVRPDVLNYLRGKLGTEGAAEFLQRSYLLGLSGA
jgi:hypothetical protein